MWWVICTLLGYFVGKCGCFVYNYKHLCRIERVRRGFGLVRVYEIEAIYRCYYLYYASVVHVVMILCILGVDLGVFVC